MNTNDDFFKTALQILGSGLISGLVGLIMLRFKRTRDAKDGFLMFISEKRGEISRDAAAFHSRTKPEFRIAIARLCPFLNSRRRHRLHHLWNQYNHLTQSEQLPEGAESNFTERYMELTTQKRFLKPTEVLLEFMDSFDAIAQ